MSIGTTKAFPKELDKSIDDIFFHDYVEAPTFFDKVARIIPSYSGSSIKESELSGIGPLRERTESDRIQFATLIEGNEKERTPTEYALGFQISQQMWEDDDRWQNIRNASSELAKSAAYKRETAFWDLFNSGFTTHQAWDGNYLWVASGRTALNGGADTSNRPAVDAALSETTLNAAIEHFKKVKGSSGRYIGMTMNMLIVPIELGQTAWQLHTNKASPGTMDNDLNTLMRDGKWSVMEVPHLTSTTAWFTLSGEHDFRFAWKRNISFDSGDDIHTGNRLYTTHCRFIVFMNNYTGTYATTGA